ncbi:MAG: hypothetical protein WBG02_07005 [Candidatus Acidiferrum sp.]
MPFSRFTSLLALVLVSRFAVAQTRPQSAPPRQLTVIHPDDAEFDSMLESNFPGVDRLDGYSTVRPYLVLLKNDSSRTVRAYKVAWETQLSTGGSRRSASFVERYDSGLASQRAAMVPGELRLVSESFDAGRDEYQSQDRHSWVATMMSKMQTRARYSSTDTQSITASVDAAIFDDGACVGPDHYQLFIKYQREIDAEQDMAKEILRLFDDKASETEVVAFLKGETDAAAAANASLSGSAFHYAFYRGRQAQTLLTLYRRGGIENVVKRAWLVTQHPQQTLFQFQSQ